MESAEEDVSTVVLAAEGVLVDFANLSHSSGEQGLQASAEEMLAGEPESVCCQFAQRLNAANIEMLPPCWKLRCLTNFISDFNFIIFMCCISNVCDSSRQLIVTWLLRWFEGRPMSLN